MNLANKITIVRIILIPFFITLLIYGYQIHALILFCLIGITDGVDGFIARIKGQKTELGTFLDPLADKLLLTTSFITLSIIGELPIWLTILVVSRDLLIVIGALLTHILTDNLVVSPSILGKSTTFVQILTISLVLLFYVLKKSSPLLSILFLTTAFLTVASGIDYIYREVKIINGD